MLGPNMFKGHCSSSARVRVEVAGWQNVTVHRPQTLLKIPNYCELLVIA